MSRQRHENVISLVMGKGMNLIRKGQTLGNSDWCQFKKDFWLFFNIAM